jgi:hypothetical protein
VAPAVVPDYGPTMRRHTPRALALLLLLLPALCASNDAAAEHRRLDETHVSRGCSGGTLCGPYTLCSVHSDCPIGRYCNNGHDQRFDGANCAKPWLTLHRRPLAPHPISSVLLWSDWLAAGSASQTACPVWA